MVEVKTSQFNRASSKALKDLHLQRVLKRVLPDREAAQRRAREEITESVWQKLREQARGIKAETIEHLDYYLELLERSVSRNGGHVHYAATSEEANKIIADIAKQHQVKNVIKTKSMATEETGLAKFLAKSGIDAVETDLGEYILQLADEPPFHMTMPALHKTRQEISSLFQKHLGSEPHTDPKELTAIARKTLRDRFAEADMGVTGANFMVAETGTIVLVTNEGNGRMVTALPKVLVSVAGIEKVVPALEDVGVFLKLLARAATGQPITSYTTFLSGPRGTMEEDGPQEFHLVLLDNGRTRLLADPELREALHCIRCGACASACPVYRKVGGHSYGWVYSGPIGAVLTPVLTGMKAGKNLPYASSLCGACRDVCPVKIDIPHLLVQLRRKIVEGDPRSERAVPWLERQVFSRGMGVVKSRESMDRTLGLARLVLKPWVRDGWVRRVNLPALKSWTSNRDFPAVAPQSFSQLWKSGAIDKEKA